MGSTISQKSNNKPSLQLDPIMRAQKISQKLKKFTISFLQLVSKDKLDDITKELQMLIFDATQEIQQKQINQQQHNSQKKDTLIKNQKNKLEIQSIQTIKFLLQLILVLKEDFQIYRAKIQAYKEYSQLLFKFLRELISQKQPNHQSYKQILVKVFLQRIPKCQSELRMQQDQQKTLLQKIIRLCQKRKNQCQNRKILLVLLNILRDLSQFEDLSLQILKIVYKNIFNPNNQQKSRWLLEFIDQMLNKQNQKVFFCYKFQLVFFSNNQNAKFHFKRQLQQQYEMQSIQKFLSIFQSLIQIDQAQQIISLILSQTNVTKIFNFQAYFNKNSRIKNQYFTLISKADSIALKLISLLYKKQRKQLLSKIAIDSFQYLAQRKQITYNFVLQRLFALSVFAYYQCRLPSKLQLVYLTQVKAQDKLIEILINYFNFRKIYQKQLQKIVTYQGQFSVCIKDQIYVRLICKLFQEKDYFNLFEQLSVQNSKKITQEISKMQDQGQQFSQQKEQQQIKNELTKISRLIRFFFSSLESPISEMIISYHLGGSQTIIYKVLLSLLNLYEGIHAKQFKILSEKLIGSQKTVIEFIKKQTNIKNKRIYSGQNIQVNLLNFSIGSELLKEDLTPEMVERIISMKMNFIQNQTYSLSSSSESLAPLIDNIDYWLNKIIQKSQLSQFQDQLQQIVKSLILTYFQNKSKNISSKIIQISNKLTNPSIQIQKTLQMLTSNKQKQETNLTKNNDKKKQKLKDLKQKQKMVLQNFKDKSFLLDKIECIICKNSKEGSPFMLGHFRYNNLYTNTVLKTSIPFMQFSTCGHSIHQECLKQLHGGEFRIWYPCILCKSVTNILLPVMSPSLPDQQKLSKIIVFLKTLGGTYTFLYRQNPKIIQFSLQDVNGVFRLLFKSLIYQITLYLILNMHYFEHSQYPVIQFIFNLITFTHRKLPHIEFQDEVVFQTESSFTKIYSYVKAKFISQINDSQNVVRPEDIDIQFKNMIQNVFDQLQRNCTEPNLSQLKCGKAYRKILQDCLSIPCEDLYDFQNRPQQCSGCKNIANNYIVCILCGWICCHNCRELKNLHTREHHLGDSIFIRTDNGRCIYVHDQISQNSSFIYTDYLGQELTHIVTAKKQQYFLNSQIFEKILNDIFMNRMHKQIVKNMN